MDASAPAESVRGLLLCHRGRTGLSQRELAARLGVQVHTVQGWEAGVTYPAPVAVVPPAGPDRRARTVYDCPACATSLLGHQHCPDCHLWARRLGPGGPCPHCDEPVTLDDLGLDSPTGGASRTT